MATILNEAQQSRGVPPRGRSAAMQGFDLAIDDKTAADIYNRIDATEGLERDVLATQLENWASRKIAENQNTAAQEHERIYTDLDGWWADRGGDEVPEEVKFGAANRKFIADQFNQTASEQGDLYPSYRDQYFLNTYGKAPSSESEAYKTISESIAASQKVNQSYDLITGDIALALFDQVNKGTPVDVPALFTKWKEENAEILAALPDDWEANALKAAGEYYAENEQMLRQHGDVLQRLYARIIKTTGRKVEGAPENDVKTIEDLNAIIDELGQLPKEVRDRGYTAILMAARRQGMEDKGFWEMAAEAWPRTLNTVRTTGLVAQETDAEAKVNLLRGNDPIFINRATGQLTPPSGTAFSPQDFEPVTDERRGELLQQAETELQRFNVIRELRDLADNRFDPVKSNAKNGVLKFVQDIALMGPQSLAYTAMAAVPVAGPFITGAAIYADEYNQLRLEGMSSSQARTLAAVSAPLQTAAEVFGAKLLFGRYKWYRETIQKLINPARFARSSQAAISFFGKVVGENITEGVQDLTTPLVKDVAAALSEEYPDVNWEQTFEQWKDSRLEVLAATLMPVIGGSLVETFNNNERFASAKRRVQLLYKPMGITDEEVRYIEDGTTPEERNKRYTETLAGMSAERVQAVKDNIASQSRLATGTQEDATRPTLETQKDTNGRLTYIVRDEAGKEVYRSTKQAAAEEAFILTSARSTAARFNEEKVQLRTLVEWWNTADPKRADNEERVVRDTMQGTAQQKLEALQQANNKQGIEELHRRIAQSPYAGTPYDQIQILGEASVEQVGEMVFRSVIALNKNSRVRDAREEMHHTAVRMAVANGRVNEQTMREWLDATERVFAEKGLGITLPRADMTDIVESMAVVQEAFENERISADVEMSLPQAFVDYIKRMIQVLAEVLKRGKAIREALDAGMLPAEFEAFLVETTGVADQTAVDRARERTEQEVGAQQNYSISLPAGTEVRWQQMQPNDIEGEDRLDATSTWSQNTNDDADNLLYGELIKDGKVVGRIMLGVNEGGIPAEVDKIWIDESMRRQGAATKLLYAAMQEAGVSMAYAPNLTKEGSAWWSTIAREIPDPQSGDIVDRVVFEPSNYSIGISPTMDADYLAAVERGDMETAQRMVDEAAMAAGNSERLFRGFRRKPNPENFKTRDGRATVSLTPVREVANLYAHDRQMFGVKKHKSSSTKEFYVNTDNYLDLRRLGTRARLDEIIDASNLGWNYYPSEIVRQTVADAPDIYNKPQFTVDSLIELLEELHEIGGSNPDIEVSDDSMFVLDSLQDVADHLFDLRWDKKNDPEGELYQDEAASVPFNLTLDVYRVVDTYAFTEAIKALGYRGIIHRDTVEGGASYFTEETIAGRTVEEVDGIDVSDDFSHDTYRPFDMSQMKLADPVTYDAQGNVIPLSQRFDATTPNINYSIVRSVDHFKNDTRFDKLVKDGRVFTGVDVNDFIDQHILLHSPDNAFAGTIQLTDGGEIKGKGGVYYPALYADDNYFWASTEAMVMRTANHLNEIGAKNGGRILMGLVSAPVEKLFSSTSMSTGVVKFLNALTNDPRAGLSKADLNAMLVAASKVEVVVQTKTKTTKKTFSTKLKASDSYAKNLAKIDTLLAPDGSIFQVRKAFVESLAEQVSKHLNATKANAAYVAGILADAENKHAKSAIKRGTLSKASFLQGLGNMLTEPFLRDFQEHGNGKIYAIVEVQGKVKGIATTEHESYPATIVPVNKKSKVKLHVLKEAVDWQDVVGKETGQYATPQERLNLLPTSGMSSTNLKVLGVKAGSTAAPINYSILARYEGMPSVVVEGGRPYSPIVRDLLKRRAAGEDISREVIDQAINENFPAQLVEVPRSVAELPDRATIDDAIDKGQRDKRIDVSTIEAGEKVAIRQDVPAMTRKGVGVVTVKSKAGNSYEAAVRITEPEFVLNEKKSLRIAMGEAKGPHIVINGKWAADQSMPDDLETWTQVGYNPDRHSFYYDRATMQQVTGGSEAYQIGNTVFVKDAQYGDGQISDISYSISTQSEIDRVQAAMDRFARSPSERIAQYAALKERLAAALERNQPIMQSMRGDTLPQDFDRTRLLNDLGFLDYILKVLPPEVRGRVGGYTNLAAIAPVDVYKGDQKVSEAKNPAGAIISAWMREGLNIGQAQKKTELPEGYSTVANTTDERRDKTIANFLIDRLKKIDRELERYYKRDLMERIFDVLDKSRPKAGDSGVKRSTLGPETQKFADMVYRASLLDDEETAKRLAAIEGEITSIEAKDEGNESGDDGQKLLSQLSEEWTIVNTFGDLKSRPSETLAYGLEWLQGQLKAGREAWNIKETARIQENRERAAKVIAFLGKPTDIGRFKNKSALQRFLQATNAFDLDHKSFEQFAFWLFGDEVSAELSAKIQQANISEAKAELETTRTILAAMRQGAKAAGMTTGKALVMFKENQSNAVRKLEGRKVKDTKISIDLAKKIVRGLADRGSLSQADVQTLADELAALPRDTKKEFVTIKQVIFRGEEVRLTMSRAQAMQLWLTWQQTDAQEKMRRDGFTDDSFEDLDNLISDPFSQAILRVTQRIYGSGYALTNPIYARMFGMNMPMVRNYAPARYLSSKQVKDIGLDGTALTAGGQPSFAKSRVNHTAKLAPEDALVVLQSHLAQQSHWVAFAEVTREYRSLLANPDVREAIRQRLGEDVLSTADMWGDQMEQRGGKKGRDIALINNALGAVIGGQSVSLLGLNLKSIAMQTDNLMRFFLALNSRQIASALSDPAALMRNIRKVWKTDIVQTRLEGGATAETRFLFTRFVSMFRRGAKISELAMMPMNYVDSAGLSVSGAIVYQAAYKDAIDSGMDERSAERAAKDAVEAMVFRYGQPVLMGQKSNIENSGGVFAKTFFLFMSDPRLKMAIISDAVRGLATGRGDWKDHVRRIVAIELMALVSHVLATGFRDLTSDDEDEDLWSMGGFARALLLAPFQGYFFLGSVSDLVLSRLTESKWFTPTQDPFIRTVNTGLRAMSNLEDAVAFDDPDALVKEWTDITRSIAFTPSLAAPAVILNLVRPLVQGWERMDDDE